MHLRQAMKDKGLEAYIIPSSDPHQSEYPADRWKGRQWVSGFTGSAGTVVVTAESAGLWTDSRYFLQAEAQLADTGIELFRQGEPSTPSIATFLREELTEGDTVGFDGNCFSTAEAERLASDLKGYLLNGKFDLFEIIWTDRPSIPTLPLFEMPETLSGASASEKIDRTRISLAQSNADSFLITALDEVAWVFNLRGTDVSCNPVGIAYGFVSPTEAVLFVDAVKVTDKVREHLTREDIVVRPYELVAEYIAALPSDARLFVDAAKMNTALTAAISAEVAIVRGLSPIALMKSCKNETEQAGFRTAHLKDGVAMTRFFRWLEQQMESGNRVTEMSASAQLTAFRAEQADYIMDSFDTICGYAGHGAIVHYKATQETDAELCSESMLLIDSGAQYADGTTDITRTIALGEPTDAMRKDFTRVLKGMITLSKSKFPVGTRGSQLDILARKALWDAGLNYFHGTGHGVGHCLNVHEGPQSIRMDENPVALEVGMVISNEPALYRTAEYGIRTENLILVREDSKTEFGTFLSFETLTRCFIDTRLVITEMLSARELAWLNRYHEQVYDDLSPLLSPDEAAWLRERTREIN